MSTDTLSDTAMITALYRAFLGREPEPADVESLTAQLAAGAMDCRGLIAIFETCEEYRERRAANAALWVPPGHFYSPIVDLAELEANKAHVFDRSRRPAAVDLNEAGQLAWVPIIRSLASDLPFASTKQEGL